MSTLLVIHTSLNGTTSLSSTLAGDVVEQWRQQHPTGTVETLDFSTTPIPHLTAATFAAFSTAPEARTQKQDELVALSDRLIAQLKRADELVLAVPMYNFGVPSQLKAYFDQIARAGITFRYASNGPEGLLDLARVTVVATRGGRYTGTSKDTQTAYLRNFLAFVGLDNVRFVYAEGTAMGDDALAEAIEKARGTIDELHATRPPAEARPSRH